MANPVSASRTDDGPPSRGEPPSTPPPEEAQVVGGLRRLSSSRRHDARAARTRPKRALVPVRPANAIANTERRLDHLQDLPFPGRLSDLLRLHDDPVSSLGGHSHTSWSVSVVAPPQSGHKAWLAGMASPVAPAARATASIPVLHPRLPGIAVWWARARSPASPPVTAPVDRRRRRGLPPPPGDEERRPARRPRATRLARRPPAADSPGGRAAGSTSVRRANLKGSTIRITPPSDTRGSDRRARPFVRPAFGESHGRAVFGYRRARPSAVPDVVIVPLLRAPGYSRLDRRDALDRNQDGGGSSSPTLREAGS